MPVTRADPQFVEALSAFLSARVLSHRGKELVEIAGATHPKVSRGVVGIAFLQAFLGGKSGLPGRRIPQRCSLLWQCCWVSSRLDVDPIPVTDHHLELDGDGSNTCPLTAYMVRRSACIDNVAQTIRHGAWATPTPYAVIQ